MTGIFLGGASCGQGTAPGGHGKAWGASWAVGIWQPQSGHRRVTPGLALSAAAEGMDLPEHMPLPSTGQSPTGASHGQGLARSQVAKEPECGLQSPSLGIVEQRPSLAFFAFLPSYVGLCSQFYSLISIKNLVSQVRVMSVIKGSLRTREEIY